MSNICSDLSNQYKLSDDLHYLTKSLSTTIYNSDPLWAKISASLILQVGPDLLEQSYSVQNLAQKECLHSQYV